MRTRLLALASILAIPAAVLPLQACGDDPVTEGPDASVEDAAPAVEASTPRDASSRDAATCDTSRDILAEVPDAAIADGASTSGLCSACVKSKCAADLTACSTSCECQDVGEEAIACYLRTQSALSCAGSFANVSRETQTLGLALFGCISDSCERECAVEAIVPPDAAADAP